MIKLFRAIRAEHKKLWNKKTALIAPVLMVILAFVLTGTGAGLGEWSEALPSPAANRILTDVMYHSTDTVSASDLTAYYTEKANAAADRLVQINANIEFTKGRKRYALERERALLLLEGGAARYRVQYGVHDEDSFAGQLAIFCSWLMTPLIALLAVLFASDMFAGEFERGTIRMTLCRPVTRVRQYFAKNLTALMYAILLMLCGPGCSVWLAISGQGNTLDRSYVGLLNGSVYQTAWVNHLAGALVCCFATVEACILMCAFIGNLTHSRTASALVPLAVLFIGITLAPWIGATDSVIPGFSIFCCIDLATPLCGIGSSMALGFSEYAASLGAHMTAFFLGGYAAFRRDVS